MARMYTDKEILKYMETLNWDTTYTAEDFLAILKGEGGEKNYYKHDIYIKMLNWIPWHKIRHIVPPDKLPELLSDEIIIGVFPRSLREKYKYVRSLL